MRVRRRGPPGRGNSVRKALEAGTAWGTCQEPQYGWCWAAPTIGQKQGAGPERQAGVRGRQSGTPNLDPSSVTEQTVDWKVGGCLDRTSLEAGEELAALGPSLVRLGRCHHRNRHCHRWAFIKGLLQLGHWKGGTDIHSTPVMHPRLHCWLS